MPVADNGGRVTRTPLPPQNHLCVGILLNVVPVNL